MSVIEVLQACRQHGTRLASRDGKLLLAGTQPSPALREALARHKAEILAWLEEASGDARARAPGPASLVDADEQGAWPLSYAQQRLWFIDQLDGASAQYNIPAAFRLTGALDLPAMQRALERVIERHEVLRTRFELTDGVPAQAVAATTPLDIPMHDLSGMAADARDAEVRRRVAEEAARPFDLARDPMLRCTVLKLGAEEHVVLFTMHHIASDGWSQGVLVREFTALYAAFNTGEADPLPPLPLQYRHFARWQREAIEGGSLAPSLAYWQSHLAGMPVVHELPLDHPRPERQSHAARQLGRRLDIARLDALKALAQAQGATLFMVLQSAFAAVLSRWSGQDDVVIGVPSAGRERPEVAPLIGFFINTLVFRQQIAPAMTGEAIIQAGKRVALDAFTHAEIPFDLLNDTLKHPRSLAYNPLCQVKFVLQNHESGQLTLPGLQLEALDGGGEQVHFDLDLSAQESTEGLYLGWTYKASLFEASSIERMARAYEALLAQWLERPQARLDELEWVDAAQSASLRALGRGADSRAGRAQPLPRALEAAAARTPDAPAVRCGGVTLDHRELDAKANRLAHALLEAGVQAGDRVGVHLERSVELMVALLACMKAGAAYVPLDHRQPPARLQAIVADAGIAVVLVDGGRSVLPVAGLDTLYMDGAGRSPDWLSEYPSSAPAVGVTDADSAYVLYTSGSTGVPKGVEISHGGLMDYCAFAREGYYGDGLGGSLVVTSPAFDLSVPSLYVPLLAGGCVELMPAEDEVAALAARLDEAGVPASLLRMTPSHVQALLAHRGEAVSACAHVFVVGGEAFGAGLARSLQAAFPHARIYNHYGPTETVVGCCWYDVSAALETLSGPTLALGRPMANTQLYVMDAGGRLQPPGVAGELWIGGAGVAKGYVNQAALTAEKFVADPFDPARRVYRSGDRVRWRADGQLEFLGRLDGQVKLRGYRIELGEIAAVMESVPGVREAAVVVRGASEAARLLAYAVGAPGEDAATLQARVVSTLQQRLPAYMQPTACMLLAALPLTANGKLDRRALPEPEQATGAGEAPATATEVALAAIWSRVLKHEGIGRDANFFELGGHSLLATRVVSEISRGLGKTVPVRALFEHSTLRRLAAHVDGQARSGHAPIPVVARGGVLPLSFAQQRLWFIDRLEGGSAQYNMPVALRLEGALDEAALSGALAGLVARHEILRTTYAEHEGEGVQVVHPPGPVALARHDLSDRPGPAREAAVRELAREEAGRPFDLARDRVLRGALVRLDADTHVLLLTVHHIASDGWSFGVLVREFTALYAGLAGGVAAPLAPLPVQYADYAAWQRERLQGEGLARELGYWRTQLAELPTVHGLPLDRPRPAQQSFEGAHLEQVFDAARTEAISAFCKARDITPFVFLQTVFAMLLGRFSREDDIVMGTPVAGRIHANVEPLIGLFLNTLVLRTRLDGDPLFETLLARSRDMVLDAHTHQEIPFETLVEDLKPTRSLAYNPLTQILINSFDAFEEASPLPGALQVSQLEAGDGEDLAKAELTLYARRSPAGTILKWSYRSGLFAAKTIERMAAALDTLVGQVLADPGRPISSYRLLTPAQELEVLAACAPRTTTLPGRCLHESVFDVAASDPSRLAIVHGDATLTFGELARRARSLAHALGDAGVRKGDIVAILLERGIDYAVAVLGALSAGATYLPLAVDLPDERLRFMLEDAGAGALLTRADLACRVGDAPRTLLLEDVREDRACADRALPAVALSDASHLLYTSGSTGRPKGAIGPHSALLNRAAWMHRAFPFREDDVCCLITSTAFVRAVWELLVPLAAGQPMVVVDAVDVVDLERLAGMLHAHRVTRVVTTPSLARALLEHPGAVARLGRLRHWFVSGEPLKPDTARFIRQSLPAVVLCNLYGSTETMSDVASHVVDDWPAGASVPIGRAIDNCALLVLDDALRPVPVGVAGEICVSGANLAIGYLGREALTAEKFPGHALGPAHGDRLYRTGDLGRLLDDGTIECLGRLDHQVKIRGYRIELGEVESRLQSSPRVRDAVVTVAGSGESSFLAAYVVPATAAEADDGAWLDALRQELRDWLPDYMCPASWIPLPGLPLTANGKVDRRALPAPELLHPDAGEPPRTATEAAIAAIWSRLLKRDDIAADAHFFEMGGHSLLATRVVGEISRALDKPVAIRKLFEYPVLRDLAAFVDTAGHAAHEGIPVADRDAALPLSFAQQRLWLVDRMQSGSAQYNMPVALELEGPLRVDALQAALDALVARHEVLRTVYADAPDGPVQRILPPMRVDLAISRATGDDPGMRRDAVLALARREALEVFDLAEGPVLRARLVELDQDAHALLLTVHHIASDGGSQAIMVRELVALYAGFAAHACPGLAPLPLQYADFAAWQRARMTDDRQAQQLDYWRTQLAGLPVVHGLPLDRPRPPRQGFDGERVEQSLPSETLAGLKALALRHDASLFMVLQAAFALLLHRWSGEEDIVVGTPVAGRLHRDLEPLIGIFVNTLVLRSDLSGDPGFDVLLARTRETVLQAFEHQEISFEALVDTLRPERSLAHAPLFQVLFALQNHEHAEVELRELSIRPLTAGHEQARVDLQLTATEHGEGLRLGWLFARDLFERASIERMGHALATLLQGIVDTPSLPVSRLPLLPVGCEEAAPVGEAGGLLVHARFEAHAAASPGRPAVACDGEQFDYATLNARANRLAHALANAGAGPETRVALHVARGIDMVAGMLGILKSGAAYVAIDPELPAERKRAILADSEAAVVLTQASLRDDLEQAIAPGIAMLDCEAVAGMDLPDGNPVPAALDSTHAAYVVYTSGSTGAPKGVILEHRGLMNLAANQQALYGAGEGSRVLAFASVGFDGATWEWLMALASGACLQVCTQAERHDPDRLADLLVEAGITHAAIPPAMLAQLDPERAYPLEVLIVAGEACEPALAWRWARRYRVCNSYGPSEATVAATHAEIQPDAPITLGTSLRNVVVRVADRHGRPQPVGVVGEICIGGVGLARGYLGQPVLTAERFVPDPLRAGERLYRTGDLGRRLPDGRIEFRGRNDHQLKLRGYRIEPGEIEARLCALAGVREALVMAREDRPGERRLVAYVAGDAAPGADADARTASWRNALKQALPDYMVPSAFVVLDALPVTPNGKVDRRALPVPVSSGSAQALPPRPGTEARLAALWSELLGVTAIGREDNFFELGGHSLLATRLVSAIGARLGRQVPVRAVFEHPRLSAFADCVDACPEVELQGIPVADRSQALALSFAQQRLWFIDRLEGGSPQYNMPMALRLRGRLDETALQAALDALVARHEPLRTVFVAHHGEARQDILPPSSLPLRRFDLSTRPAAQRDAALQEAIASEAAAAFDLSRDPMLRCALLKLDADEHVLVMTVHHIASDGWSQGILAREFAAVYAATTRGEGRPDLPLPPLQYADYAAWQRSRLGGEAGLRRHVDYWREQLAGIPVSHALPLDRPRPPKQRFEGRRVEHTLDAATTARLNALAATHDASLFMVLHAAFALLVSRWSGESDVVIGTPIAGRAHPDLEGLVGFFINTLALRVEVDGASSFEDLLVQARATALAAFEHQDVPFDMLVEALRPDRSLNHAPIFQISFSFHNIEQPVDVRLPGLTIEGVRGAEDAARFDLELHVGETADGLRISWLYAQSLFDHDTIERMSRGFEALLGGIANAPASGVLELPMVDAAQAAQLAAWGEGERVDVDPGCVHALFERHARATPAAIAIVHDGESLDYDTLNRESNRLAHYLREQGVGAGDVVGLCTERSADMVVGLLGILKAGAAYLPLDPEYPEERVLEMLDEAGAEFVVTHASVLGAHPALSDRSVLPLDAPIREALLAGQPGHDIAAGAAGIDARSLAYVVFTSGSTGRPKGVLVEHGGLVNLAANQRRLYAITPSSQVLAFASIGFDAAVWEWLMALAHGATLHVCGSGQRGSAVALCDLLEHARITHATLPPALLPQLDPDRDYALEALILAGEAPDTRSAWAWAGRYRVCNAYGPSENTVAASSVEVAPGRRIMLGRPMANVRARVVNAAGGPQPVGVAGELLLGGAGLARGYLGRAELTAERFIEDAARPGERLYRTGDLVRWAATGEMEFVGRVDDQVKIRGFRIETGEIEVRLREHPSVREAVVAVHGASAAERRLVAYVVVAGAGEGDDDAAIARALRVHLRQTLPEYMVPAAFVGLERLPLNRNGKIDKARLPEPRFGEAREHVEPVGPTERALAALWAELLDVDGIGRDDNFFELGGHSLLAIKLGARFHERFGKALNVSDLFAHPSLAELAACLDGRPAEGEGDEAWCPLVGLSTTADAPTVYCVPGAGLTSAAFVPLARAAGDRLRVRVFESRGFRDGQAPHANVEAIVEENIAALLCEAPAGPYLLAGHSFGGAVAFEMARVLEARGEQVGVVLLDSLLCLDEARREASSSALASMLGRWISGESGVDEDTGPDGHRERLQRHLQRSGLLSASDPAALDRFLGLIEAQIAAFAAYRPSGRVGGPVGVVLAAQGQAHGIGEANLVRHYQMHCERLGAPVTLQGGHVTLLSQVDLEPLVDALFSTIRAMDKEQVDGSMPLPA